MLRRLFGDDAAENDAHLSEYFIETPAYRMALSGEKRFIVGRKGAGKSAICQQLQKQLPQTGALCLTLAPQRLQFTALKLGLRDLSKWGNESDTLLQRVWYYGLLCETALLLVRRFKKDYDSDFVKLAAFIEKHYSYSEPSAFARLLKTTSHFLEQFELRLGPVKMKSSNRAFDPLALEMALDNLRVPLATFIARHLPQGVFILIDNLDEGWDNSPEANAFLRGLLLAVYEICQPNIPVRVLVFFRLDMYDCVTRQFQHIDKYRQFQEHIYWGRKEMMELVAERLSVNLRLKLATNTSEVWAKVFEPSADFSAMDYIIERSLMRPREVLQFCRLAAEKADQREHEKILPEDLYDAEKEFSRWKIDDLCNEFLFAYPGLKEEILQRFYGVPVRLSPEKLRHLLEDALTDPRKRERPAWIETVSHTDMLAQVLYDIGFLRGSGQNKIWQSSQHPDFDLTRAEAFNVHPAFRSYLRIG